jgi:ribokinase
MTASVPPEVPSDCPRIVVIGSLVLDFVARADRLPRPGETVLGDMFGMFPGGKGANQAVQASRLGAEVYLIGRVGTDSAGDRLLASLQESKVKTDFVKRDSNASTAACCIHVDREGRNSIVIVPGANGACGKEDIEQAHEIIREADVILTQLEIPITTVEHAAEIAGRWQVPFILNPAPAQQLSRTLLSRVTILTPNETEAELLTGVPNSPESKSWEVQAAALLTTGPETVIITLGERGAFLAIREWSAVVPAVRVEPVDTTAAGDAFNGALAVALAEGRTHFDAVSFANIAGAISTARIGAQPSMAWREEIEAFLTRERKD